MTVEFRKAITEVLDILSHMDRNYIDRIPSQFMNFLKRNRLYTYNPNFDHSKELKTMELNEDTKNILAIIYFKYLCDKNQRIEFMEKIKANEIEYQKKVKKY